MNHKDKKGYGLLPLPKDDRDFSFGGTFTLPKLSELPDEYEVETVRFMKDQNGTDMCSAYALSAVSEDQEDVALSPFYTFAKIKEIMGGDLSEWGADLRSACKAATTYGFLEVRGVLPVPTSNDRDDIVNRDWSIEDRNFAGKKHAKKSYFNVDGHYDMFDNMRATMWKMQEEDRSIFTGITWRPSWDLKPGGVIKDYDKNESGYGHAIKIFGWKIINGETFLMAQLSNGTLIGDGGIFYLSREIINTKCTFGAYTFADLPREDVEYKLGRIGFFNYWLKFLFQ